MRTKVHTTSVVDERSIVTIIGPTTCLDFQDYDYEKCGIAGADIYIFISPVSTKIEHYTPHPLYCTK